MQEKAKELSDIARLRAKKSEAKVSLAPVSISHMTYTFRGRPRMLLTEAEATAKVRRWSDELVLILCL